MRLCFVTDLAYPDHLGGSHRVVYETARRLAGRGHEVHVLTGQPSGRIAPSEESLAGAVYHRIHRLRWNPVAQALSYSVGAGHLFHRLTRTRPFDAVSGHYPLTMLGMLHVPRSAASRVVYTFHGPWAEEYRVELRRGVGRAMAPLLHATARHVERLVLSRSAQVHTLSRFMADQAHSLPLAQAKVDPS